MKIYIISLLLTLTIYPMSAAINDNPSFIPSSRLKIIAGETVLYATIYDNPTSRAFLKILPLKLNAFDRIGLVKSNELPHQISDAGKRTRKYEKGAVFYWHEGPEVAFCYSEHLPQTVVDIIHIGKIESGIELFETYTGELQIELIETPDNH